MVVGSGAGRGGGVCQHGKKLERLVSDCEVVVLGLDNVHVLGVTGERVHLRGV